MDRRDFLRLSLATPFVASSLHALQNDSDDFIKDALEGCHYDPLVRYTHDIYISKDDYSVAKSLFGRLKNIQSTVGYGNFNIIGFDEAMSVARRYSRVGAFRTNELELFEKLFHFNARNYGFYGDKVLDDMTKVFARRDMIKVPHTGHFLYKGEPLKQYEIIRSRVGNSIILTSGVRSVVKQMYLFLNKTFKVEGNLSLASTSLAPAGYSYHGVGDFDVGKVGFGHRNFTIDFEETDEFKRLMELGFVVIRYPQKNPFGVRYEPWHIKVI